MQLYNYTHTYYSTLSNCFQSSCLPSSSLRIVCGKLYIKQIPATQKSFKFFSSSILLSKSIKWRSAPLIITICLLSLNYICNLGYLHSEWIIRVQFLPWGLRKGSDFRRRSIKCPVNRASKNGRKCCCCPEIPTEKENKIRFFKKTTW